MRISVGMKGDGQASCDAEWCGGHGEVELSNKGVSVFFGWRICLVKRRRSPSFFFKVFSYLIIGCAGSSLRLSGFLCGRWQTEATLHCGVQASQCSDFSCCRAWSVGAWASVVVAHRLRCLVPYGIFSDQGLNLCPLHWHAES